MPGLLRRGHPIKAPGASVLRSSAGATVIVCVLSSLYAAGFMFRGWIPHDEGTIAQSAARVLAGEVPHRDFDELYTGGLTYVHAAAMRFFGVDLRATRIVLLAFFVVFVAAVHTIASRLAPPLPALIATLVAVVWSVPNYFVSLPSWYNLFFATFGTLSVIVFLDTGRRRWLFVAGICGGLSVVAKITGVYFVAAALLSLAYVEHSRAIASRLPRSHSLAVRVGMAVIFSGILIAALVVLTSRLPLSELVVLAGPLLLIAVFVMANEVTHGVGSLAHRFGDLLRLVGPFSVGAAMPLAAFGMFYWQAGAWDDLVRGLFVLPQARLEEGNMRLPALATVGLAVPYAALLIPRRKQSIRHEGQWAVASAAALAVALALGEYPATYRSVWAIARSMPLVAALAGLWMIQRWSGSEPLPSRSRELMFLSVTVAAAVSLVQFPYASPTYFFYVAPVVALAVLALVSLSPAAPRRLHAAVALFFVGFALLYTNRSYGWNLGQQFIRYQPTSRLELDRGGLLVPEEDKREYEALVNLLEEHPIAGTIYAGPDCPEVYFLAGFANPTRTIFEFLSPEVEDARWMEDLLRRAPIRAVVINTEPLFSGPLDRSVLALLERRFPTERRIGRFRLRFE